MALESIDNVTVGVSKSGFEKIKEDIKLALVTDAQAALRDTDDVVSALREAWSGDDCENFIANLGGAVEEVCSALDTYNTAIEEKLDEVYESWATFQHNNVT